MRRLIETTASRHVTSRASKPNGAELERVAYNTHGRQRYGGPLTHGRPIAA